MITGLPVNNMSNTKADGRGSWRKLDPQTDDKSTYGDRESYITKRYRLWRDLAVPFAYKRRKGARIAQIINETGAMDSTMVELGVGPGGIAAEISRSGVHVIGIDLSPDALARAKDHCRFDRVSLIRASGFRLPFPSESFGLLYAPQVLHLFEDVDRLDLMREVHRVLRPDSRFVFDMKNALTHIVRYSRSTRSRRARNYPGRRRTLELLRQSGFSSVETFPGVLPGLSSSKIPNVRALQLLAHTTFYVARK